MKFYVFESEYETNEFRRFKKAFPTKKLAMEYFDWQLNKVANMQHDIKEHAETDFDICMERKVSFWDDDCNEGLFTLHRCSFKKPNKTNIINFFNHNPYSTNY